jgi:thioredoxin-like negative regulator of GroEL
MRGLSQIKLGKLEEAKASLTSAVALRKTNCDAYFRLALLEIQDGDSKAARKRLKQLKKAARKNDKRPSYKIAVCDKVETEAQVAYLQAALQ